MRGALLVVVAITLLIVGILVIKNMQSSSVDDLSKKEVIEKAEKTAESAEDAMERLKESTRRAMDMDN